jgi:hypothetical protein
VFTDRPPLTAHTLAPFTRANARRATDQPRQHVNCRVCGVIGTVSAFGDVPALAAPILADHVKLVASVANLPDRPNVCLACKKPHDRATWCARHVRMDLTDAIRRHVDSGDVRRIVAAWRAMENAYDVDTEDIAREAYGADYARIDAAVLAAYQELPRLEAREDQAHRERIASLRAAGLIPGPGVMWSSGDPEEDFYPEDQSTLCRQTGV